MKSSVKFVLGAVVLVGILAYAFSFMKTPPPAMKKPMVTTTPSPTATTTPLTSYTQAQVATHKDATSCWTTIRGGVYDLTAWISQHPGGEQAILGLCGIEGTTAFEAQHGGQRRPENELASLKIGIIK